MKKGFTVAEVIITLAIIGVIAAVAIPSVVNSITQQEYRSGLKKAVSQLNSAITAGTTFGGDTPYSNSDLFGYLQKYMSVLKTTDKLPWESSYKTPDGIVYKSSGNAAFYTVDGMRFEFLSAKTEGGGGNLLKLHESNLHACMASAKTKKDFSSEEIRDGNITECGGCGSLGLRHDPNGTETVPCAILVDVNGDRKPNPSLLKDGTTSEPYRVSELKKSRLSDIFVILITENRAIPYGVAAQSAMYTSRK